MSFLLTKKFESKRPSHFKQKSQIHQTQQTIGSVKNQKGFIGTHRRFVSGRISFTDIDSERRGQNKKLVEVYLKNITNNMNKQGANQLNKMRRINLTIVDRQDEIHENNGESNNVRKGSFIKNKSKRKSNLKLRKVSNFSLRKNSLLRGDLFSNQFETGQNQNFLTVDYDMWKIQIGKISGCLHQLCSFGANPKKIHRMVYNYFDTKKKGLVQIFMNLYRKKKSLNDETVYYAVKDEQKLLGRVMEIAQMMPQKERYFLGIEITMYRNFLQQKIANKHQLELNQVQTQIKHTIDTIEMKRFAKELHEKTCTSPELMNFFNELTRLEEIYGKLNLISIKNRKRFENLNASQNNLMKLIHG